MPALTVPTTLNALLVAPPASITSRPGSPSVRWPVSGETLSDVPVRVREIPLSAAPLATIDSSLPLDGHDPHPTVRDTEFECHLPQDVAKHDALGTLLVAEVKAHHWRVRRIRPHGPLLTGVFVRHAHLGCHAP